MKILFLIHKQQARGQEVFAAQLAQEFILQGLEVKMVSLYAGSFALPFEGKIQCLGLNSSKAIWNTRIWKEFADLVADFRPQLIQANGGDTLKFLALASLFISKKPKLIFNNGGVMSHYIRNAFQKKANAFFLRRMNGLISVSQFSHNDLENTFSPGIPHQVVPIGICIPAYHHKERGDFTWVHIGGFTTEKNHTGLIEIFNRAVIQGIKGNLRLIGEGPLRREIEKQVQAKNLESRVGFPEVSENPWLEVARPTVLLLPSTIEGMPAVIAEALCLGIPVIAYAVGGIAELKGEFPSLVLVPAQNQRAFIQAMVSVQESYEDYLAKSEEKTEKAKSFFSLKRASRDLLNFYSQV